MAETSGPWRLRRDRLAGLRRQPWCWRPSARSACCHCVRFSDRRAISRLHRLCAARAGLAPACCCRIDAAAAERAAAAAGPRKPRGALDRIETPPHARPRTQPPHPNPQAPKPNNFLRGVIGTRPRTGAPGRSAASAARRTTAPGRVRRPTEDPRTLPGQRLPACRPRQEHLPELRPGAPTTAACATCASTTPTRKEEQEYVDAIIDDGALAGIRLERRNGTSHLYWPATTSTSCTARPSTGAPPATPTSTSSRAEEMRANRGDFAARHRQPVPHRRRRPRTWRACARCATASTRRRDGAAGEDRHGLAHINLRDPAIYRIKRATHHRTGDKWCLYPMYTYAHPIEDALERITHNICTLEFEDQRPSTTGCWSAWPPGPAGQPVPPPARVRPPQPDLRDDQQAQS